MPCRNRHYDGFRDAQPILRGLQIIPAPHTRFTSPRLRGEVDRRRRSGEGHFCRISADYERIETPPHPARSFAARHPLPASGERARAILAARPAPKPAEIMVVVVGVRMGMAGAHIFTPYTRAL